MNSLRGGSDADYSMYIMGTHSFPTGFGSPAVPIGHFALFGANVSQVCSLVSFHVTTANGHTGAHGSPSLGRRSSSSSRYVCLEATTPVHNADIHQGYESYVTRGPGGIIAAYILVPWFVVLLIGWKYWHNEEFTPLSRIDLVDGKREIDIEEENWHIRRATRPPLPWWKRLSEYV